MGLVEAWNAGMIARQDTKRIGLKEFLGDTTPAKSRAQSGDQIAAAMRSWESATRNMG